MDNAPTVAEEFAMALATALYRKGVLDAGDFLDMAAELEAKAAAASGSEAERLADAARLATCVPIEADAPTASDWNADNARARFRLIDGGADS